MELGDFKKELSQMVPKRYLTTISPELNHDSFIKEANEIYSIAIYELFINTFNINNQDLKTIYKNALLYFRGDDRSDWDLNKGLFMHGNTGCGKSVFFDIFKIYTSKLNHNSFIKSKQTKIIAEVGKSGISAIEKYIKQSMSVILYIDDFGSSNSELQYYGTNFDVMDELIQGRYDEFVKTGALTHVTTNVKPKDFKDKFNDRITSRMNQMFNVIQFPDKDYRRS